MFGLRNKKVNSEICSLIQVTAVTKVHIDNNYVHNIVIIFLSNNLKMISYSNELSHRNISF